MASETRASLEAAGELRKDVRDDSRRPGSIDAEDAGEVLDEEYAPLMDPADRVPGSLGPSAPCDARAVGESIEQKVRKLEMRLTYSAFFILGATILLPWNAILVSSSYFRARLLGSPFEDSHMSWVTGLFTAGNLGFLAHANFSQAKARPTRRIALSIIFVGVFIVVLALSSLFSALPPKLFFYALLAIALAEAAGASYLQNAVVALSSLFGPYYLQAILSGQGAIGAVVATVQLLSAIGASVPSTTVDGPEPGWVGEKQRHSTLAFFLISAGCAAVAFICHAVLIRLPFYDLVVIRRGGLGVEGHPSARSHAQHSSASRSLRANTLGSSRILQPTKIEADLRTVERKVRLLGLSICFVFTVTLAVFPSVTASILSVSPPPANSKPTSAPGFLLTTPLVFVALHFVVFNFGDWLGRVLPQWQALQIKGSKKLACLSAGRLIFVALFLGCNVQVGGGRATGSAPLFNSDWAYMLILLAFAVSNGFTSTLIMMQGISLPSLEKHEVDTAATCLAFYLTLGLALGSFTSFGIRALVCDCNPFLQ